MSVSVKLKDKIQDFIKKEFKKNHILTRNNKVFNFYYKSNNKLNFILDKKKNIIKSLIGFIPSKKFNSKKLLKKSKQKIFIYNKKHLIRIYGLLA